MRALGRKRLMLTWIVPKTAQNTVVSTNFIWRENYVDTHSFRRVSCNSQNSHTRKLGEISIFYTVTILYLSYFFFISPCQWSWLQLLCQINGKRGKISFEKLYSYFQILILIKRNYLIALLMSFSKSGK